MDSFISFICENAHNAHWILFLMFILGAFNLPFSEELLLITGGVIAGSCIPDHTIRMIIWVYLGCIISAWVGYSIGRFLGPKLFTINFFKKLLTHARVEKIIHYYEKFGVFLFIVIRFCPGGFRNALFYTSGLVKMPFYLFAMRDGIACIFCTSVYFTLGYLFSQNYTVLFANIKKYDIFFLRTLLLLAFLAFLIYLYKKFYSKNDRC